MTSESIDFVHRLLKEKRETEFIHLTILIQGFIPACTESCTIQRKKEREKEGKRVSSVYILISYSIKLIIPHRFNTDRISFSRRSINV